MSAIKLKNKIYIVLIAIVLIVIAIVAILLINNSTNRVVITNDKEEKVMNTNALTMMYETEAGSGEYQVTSDTTWPQDGYIFNERLSGCENGSTLTWDDERKAVILSTNVSDKCYVYFDKEPTLAEYITTQVYLGTDGENDLYYHAADLTYGAKDNSYRYYGSNPNNYVCFGSNAATCPKENMYRIIGVFGNQVKLIMSDYPTTNQTGIEGSYVQTYEELGMDSTYKGSVNGAQIGTYRWNPSGINYWNDTGNTFVIINLNTRFLNSINTSDRIKIADATWYIDGNSDMTDLSPSGFQYAESTGTTWTGKIGLMYVSDYGFASPIRTWVINTNVNELSIANGNWMYMGLSEWTITRNWGTTGYSYYVRNDGAVWSLEVRENNYAFRPVFYLNSDVQYISGSGTQSDPFRIA